MATWTPDPTFYPSPRMAMKAPAETLAYVASFDPRRQVPDGIAVVDVGPASAGEAAPKVVFHERRVMTVRQGERWFAVIGVPLDQPIGPYPLTVGRDRITDETAALEPVDPKHRILHEPNELTPADFDLGRIQLKEPTPIPEDAPLWGKALGLALPHSALAPSGEPAWLELGRRSALALIRLDALGLPLERILTQRGLENAMVVHAAFGGSTNLLLHIPAIAHAAGLRRPTVDDWIRVNRATPRLVDALPNGPRGHPTVQVFMAGGVPEVMLHLRRMGLLHGDVLTATGDTLNATLDWWEASERRREARARLAAAAVAPDDVIMGPDAARRAGMTGTVVFPVGNLAPEGAVIKATALDPSVVGDDQVYRHRGPARVFVDERDAIRAVKGEAQRPIQPGDVIVLIGNGP